MILVEHNFSKIIDISYYGDSIDVSEGVCIGQTIYNLSNKYPDEVLIWYHYLNRDKVNFEFIKSAFHSDRLMMSFNCLQNFLSVDIGYVEDSPFIKVPKDVRYPTWQMSSLVGGMTTNIIVQTNEELWKNSSFDFCLNCVAKMYQPVGLFCYSEPQLLIQKNEIIPAPVASYFELYNFVRIHYKLRWVFLLTLNLLIYEQSLKMLPLLYALFFKKNITGSKNLNFTSYKLNIDLSCESIDVIIPTIGREKYLYDVLLDLKKQTHLPRKVIIVEQNPIQKSNTALPYIEDEVWPFKIEHIFTHKTGACQARNLAMTLLESKWTFFADDDILFENSFLSTGLQSLISLNIKSALFNCLRIGDINDNILIAHTTIFGGGCSIVLTAVLENKRFRECFEFGFGEDADFGMQLRNSGVDVVFFPKPAIVHLKAPTGGFRTKFSHPWDKIGEFPKPSPSIMLYKKWHNTAQQISGFKTTLFLKYYRKQKIKNPVKYYLLFRKEWHTSLRWAKKLSQ